MGTKTNNKTKVLVAMSGGVDSSVAAALLVSQGYDVTGVFVVNYEASLSELRPTSSVGAFTEHSAGEGSFTGHSVATPCWTGDYQDALRVAAHLGIPLMRWDFKKEYKKAVLDYMYEEYRLGRTPNPDVLCNKFVKFGAWLDKAKKLGFAKLATGHYARLREVKVKSKKEKVCQLFQAKDDNKDQTYFLHQLNQGQLSHTLFPLGNYTKPQVRKLAKKFGLPTADKEESMGICFVGEVPMKEFLMKEIKIKKGNVVLSNGEVLGEHDGLSFYTIGQRYGLPRNPILSNLRFAKASAEAREGSRGGLPKGKGDTRPLFVVDKKAETNELIVGYEDDPLLYKKVAEIIDINWTSGQTPKFPLKCEVRLRHRQPLQACILHMANGQYTIEFTKLQRAVTPGQFAVFYSVRSSSKGAKADKRRECLGGGTIK